MNTSKSTISKKHLIAIAVVLALGVGAGAFILQGGGKPKAAAAEGDGHGHGGHTEAKGHGDGEHHGKAGEKGHDDDKGHADGEHHEKSGAKGAHGGTVFKEGDFSLEALLSEDGGEPRLRIWLFDKDKALPLNAATVTATVTRLTDEKQKLTFVQEKDSLVSKEIVPEPHAFEIEIIAQTATEPFMFVMSKEEGKVELADAQIKAASITVDTTSAANIKTALLLPGEIKLNEDLTSHVVPRLAGVVESVRPALARSSRRDRSWLPLPAPLPRNNAASCRRPTSAWPWPRRLTSGKRSCGSRRCLPSRTTCRPGKP